MEFPIFSLFVSFLSIISGNETNSHIITNTSRKVQLPIENKTMIVKYIVDRVKPLISSRTQRATSTTTTSTTTTSRPLIPTLDMLCPDQAASQDPTRYRTRYHNQTKRCYTAGTTGPCGSNMRFYAVEEDDIFGECGCIIDEPRILIEGPNHDQCHYIFKQGYCKKNQWLDITRDGRPFCTRNPCYSILRRNLDFVQFNGRCVEVGNFARGCNSSQIVGFQRFRRPPTCVSTVIISSRAIGVPTTPCSAGSVRSLDGRCSVPFDFD